MALATASPATAPARAADAAAARGWAGLGWEYLHVASDDASRLAYTALMPDETQESAVRFLEDALASFNAHGVSGERVITDNGSAFKSKLFAAALQSFAVLDELRALHASTGRIVGVYP